MELLLLGLLGLALTWGVVDLTKDDDDTASDGSTKVHSNESFIGSRGDDTIDATGRNGWLVRDSSIDGGAGDDLIEIAMRDSDVMGGAGNDTITGIARTTAIQGGDGDDLIDVEGSLSAIEGGAGNDTLIAAGRGMTVEGGDGDDVIDARGIFSTSVHGDGGNDRIHIGPEGAQGGNTFAYGGDGDDTLIADVIYDPNLYYNEMEGGEGADLFQVNFDPNHELETDSKGAVTLTKSMIRISDFTPGLDKIELNIQDLADGTRPTIELIESLNKTGSWLEITYDTKAVMPDGTSRIMTIDTDIWLPRALGVTMNDIVINHLRPAA